MSTIMKALRKVEDQKTAAAQAADPGELDRQIVANEKAARSGSGKRVLVIVGAVVASGLAGVGLTLGALSLWQANRGDASSASGTTAVSAPASVQVANAEPTRAGDTTVVVAADVLKQNADTRAAGSFAAPTLARDAVDDSSPEDLTATPPVSAPVSTRVVGDPEALARLKARREARLSRMPAKSAEAVATRAEAKPAKIDTEAEVVKRAPTRVTRAPAASEPTTRPRGELVAPKTEVAEGTTDEDKRPDNPIAQHQLAETLAIEAELAEFQEADVDEVEVVGAARSAMTFDDDSDTESDFAPRATPEQQGVPRFAINGTTWHPHRQRRTAVVSVEEAGETRVVEVREGESVGPLKVTEIGPTGVTFSHEGKQVKRRIGAGLR